jgi:drug/metabolite transporter (DMT)-like permease
LDSRSVFGKKRNIILFALLAALLWGIGYSGTKLGYSLLRIALDDIPSKILFAGVRFVIAGLILLCFSFLTTKKLPLLKGGDLKGIVQLAFFQTILQYGALYIALAHISGAKSSILNQIGSFLLILLSHFLYRNDFFTFSKVLGCVSGFLGIVLINLGNGISRDFSFAGEGLVIISSVSGAVGYVVSKRISQSGDPVLITGYQQFFGGLVLSICGFLLGGKLWLRGAKPIGILVYLSLSIAVAYALWVQLLKYNNVSQVSVFKFAVPVFGVLSSGIILGENILTLKNWLSLLLVCAGIIIINVNNGEKGRR